jgi:hypothetical protein
MALKYFPAGPKSGPEEYDGGRIDVDIVNWALERHTVNIRVPEFVQSDQQRSPEGQLRRTPLVSMLTKDHALLEHELLQDRQSQTNNST